LKIVAIVFGLLLMAGGMAETLLPREQKAPATAEAGSDAESDSARHPTDRFGGSLLAFLTGAVLTGCGLLAHRKPDTTPLAMRAAAGVTLLATMAAARSVPAITCWLQDPAMAARETTFSDLAVTLQGACFVILSVASFARQPRQQQGTPNN
jgi:hypothetical protein